MSRYEHSLYTFSSKTKTEVGHLWFQFSFAILRQRFEAKTQIVPPAAKGDVRSVFTLYAQAAINKSPILLNYFITNYLKEKTSCILGYYLFPHFNDK